jgi:hypothetical protein
MATRASDQGFHGRDLRPSGASLDPQLAPKGELTSDHDRPHTVQTLDDALREAEVGGRTRRWLLERAAVGVAGAAAGGALAPVATAASSDGGGSVRAFGTVAVTTEALTVTLVGRWCGAQTSTPRFPPPQRP